MVFLIDVTAADIVLLEKDEGIRRSLGVGNARFQRPGGERQWRT